MKHIKIVLFMLDHASARAIDRAGADWLGGETRRARADAHEKLAVQATRALLAQHRK